MAAERNDLIRLAMRIVGKMFPDRKHEAQLLNAHLTELVEHWYDAEETPGEGASTAPRD